MLSVTLGRAFPSPGTSKPHRAGSIKIPRR
ncbi:hypothetical protein [Caudoviricetes sp.]|nr:hypothetical protein [Caudoviricetes sp.]